MTPQNNPPWITAKTKKRGRFFEDFSKDQKLQHPHAKTLTQTDNNLFIAITMQMNPLYLNRQYAQKLGHETIPIHPLLVFNTILGISVEDLSEAGGVFLGLDKLAFRETVYPNDTLTAASQTIQTRPSQTRPTHGIVRWKTQGFNQKNACVLEYERANLIPRKQTQ